MPASVAGLKGQKTDGGIKISQRLSFKDVVPASVARCRRTPPYAAKRKDLVSATRTAYAAKAIAGAELVFATVRFGPITVVPCRVKAGLFQRLSILFRPQQKTLKMSALWWSRRVPPPGPNRLLGAFIEKSRGKPGRSGPGGIASVSPVVSPLELSVAVSVAALCETAMAM